MLNKVIMLWREKYDFVYLVTNLLMGGGNIVKYNRDKYMKQKAIQ